MLQNKKVLRPNATEAILIINKILEFFNPEYLNI